MLFDLRWLEPGEVFPPQEELARLRRYHQNATLFNGNHFTDPLLRSRDEYPSTPISLYMTCAERISKVIGNFDEVVSFPTLLNYQRLMSLKMADLVCGEYPNITGATPQQTDEITNSRDYTDFDSKLFSTVLDISRFGDALWKMFIDDSGEKTFTCWSPTQWFPIIAQDGTMSILQHCLCWRENTSLDELNPNWLLHVHIHDNRPGASGNIDQRVYQMYSDGITIGQMLSREIVFSGFDACPVIHLKAYSVTNTVYGYDDYMQIDSVLAEIMARLGQISAILDKHADPNITGPVSMLEQSPKTGEWYLKSGKFFAVSPGEDQPQYMTWDGQLSAAFQQLEFLVNQLYIISEMGSALLGAADAGSQAISGTAMRFKMVNPLAKARRVSNALTRPVKQLLSQLSNESITFRNVSVFWADGLPDDPRENVEIAKLATGETKMMPLEYAIMEYFNRSYEEAKDWVEKIKEEAQALGSEEPGGDPNKPGPQDGTGVNPQEKGSEMGLNNFSGLNN